MVTVLQYFVIAALIGVVVFFIAVAIFGRGEKMSALPPRTSPAELPDGAISGDDIRRIRFAVGTRGYRMSDVDWTLDRAATELDRLRAEVTRLGGDPAVVSPAAENPGELVGVSAAPVFTPVLTPESTPVSEPAGFDISVPPSAWVQPAGTASEDVPAAHGDENTR